MHEESQLIRSRSWSQRYQNETAELLDDLNSRVRELEIMAGTRRPSMWQHTSSTGSIGSNNGSSRYGSPHNSAQGQPLYQSPQMAQNYTVAPARAGYGDASTLQYYNPQPYQNPQQLYQQPSPNAQQVRPPGLSQSGSQEYTYTDATAAGQAPIFSMNPHSQFGTWGGYGGPSVPDTLDEENAVPPNSAP